MTNESITTLFISVKVIHHDFYQPLHLRMPVPQDRDGLRDRLLRQSIGVCMLYGLVVALQILEKLGKVGILHQLRSRSRSGKTTVVIVAVVVDIGSEQRVTVAVCTDDALEKGEQGVQAVPKKQLVAVVQTHAGGKVTLDHPPLDVLEGSKRNRDMILLI